MIFGIIVGLALGVWLGRRFGCIGFVGPKPPSNALDDPKPTSGRGRGDT